MLTPFSEDLVARRTNDFRTRLTLTESINSAPATPVDLTGCDVFMQVRPEAGDPTEYVDIDSIDETAAGSTIDIVTPASGIIEVFIAREEWSDDADSTPVSADKVLAYEIVVRQTGGNGDIMTYGEGNLTLKTGVTVVP